jgi:hypothetical protein
MLWSDWYIVGGNRGVHESTEGGNRGHKEQRVNW